VSSYRHHPSRSWTPTSPLPRFVAAGALAAATLAGVTAARADQIGPYSSRTLTLGRGTLRIDGGAPDFGYFHPASPQALNENRGFRLQVPPPEGDVAAWLGVGVAGGITDDIEVGGLVLPLKLGPEADIDDLEAYGRFRFLDGPFEMAFQATLQFPAYTNWGLGLGLPMLAHVGQGFRIDTGFELEMLFPEQNTIVALDVPAAFTWDLGPYGFLGLRTGLYAGDLVDDHDRDDRLGAVVPLGIHGGGVLGRGKIDLSAWFMWPWFLDPGRDRPDPTPRNPDHREPHPIEVEGFEIGFGINGRIPT